MELTGFQPALRSDILAIHEEKYVATLELASSRSTGSGQALVVESAPTYVTGSTNGDAFLAAGAVLALVDNVVAASRQQEASGSEAATGQASKGTLHHCFCCCPASRGARNAFKDLAIIRKAQSAAHCDDPLFRHGIPTLREVTTKPAAVTR